MNVPAIGRSFRKQIPLMIVVFVVLSALAWYFGGKMKRTYSANGRLMVMLSDEYVYQPVGGTNTGGLMTTPDYITLNEIGIMRNPDLIEQVVGEVGVSRLYPEEASKLASSSEQARLIARNNVLKKFDSSLGVSAVPKSSIIDIYFEHENPDVAVETINSVIDAYLIKRREVFDANATNEIGERRAKTEEQLGVVDQAIASFLSNNRLTDFDSERRGARERAETLKGELNTLRANIREAETALATVEDTLRQTPPTIDLFVDDRASQRLAQAELERKQLLSKYLPSSDVVKAKDREIAEIRNLIGGRNGATGGRRVGPNPTYQALLAQRNGLQATADSYREKEVIVVRQLRAAQDKVALLSNLSPEYENLLREKQTLETRLVSLNAREQEALVRQQTQNANFENIKVINRASLPRRGRNMKKIVRFVGIAGAAMTALMIGLLGVFLDPSIYGGSGAGRGSRSGSRGRRESDRSPTAIPEAVPAPAAQPYQPQPYQPEPYQPAAYAQQQQTGYEYADPYAQQAYQNQYTESYQATGTDGQAYAQPQSDNPYAYALEGQTSGGSFQNNPNGPPVIGQT